MWHGNEDKSFNVGWRRGEYGEPKEKRDRKLYPRWKSSPHLGLLPEVCPFSVPGALFKFSELLFNYTPSHQLTRHFVLRDSRNQLAFHVGNMLPMPWAFGLPQSLRSDFLGSNTDSTTHFLALPVYTLLPPLRVVDLHFVGPNKSVRVECVHMFKVPRTLPGTLLSVLPFNPQPHTFPEFLGHLQDGKQGPLPHLNLEVR